MKSGNSHPAAGTSAHTGARRWTFDSGTGLIVNPQSGRRLDATGVSFANGPRPQIWDRGGGADQRWTRG